MHASSARWQCWERHQMAWALASSSTDTSLLVKQFPDGNLWETISSRLCHGPWTLEASGEQVIFDQFRHQLVQCEKCHGHESSLWGVIFVSLLLCLTKAQYASHIRPSFIGLYHLFVQICSSSKGRSSMGHECGQHRLSRYTSHYLWAWSFWHIPWLVWILQHIPTHLRSTACWSSILKAEKEVEMAGS